VQSSHPTPESTIPVTLTIKRELICWYLLSQMTRGPKKGSQIHVIFESRYLFAPALNVLMEKMLHIWLCEMVRRASQRMMWTSDSFTLASKSISQRKFTDPVQGLSRLILLLKRHVGKFWVAASECLPNSTSRGDGHSQPGEGRILFCVQRQRAKGSRR
jgi:hypothetical protein